MESIDSGGIKQIEYNYQTKIAYLYLEVGRAADKDRAIEFFRFIDPLVEIIHVHVEYSRTTDLIIKKIAGTWVQFR